MFALMVGLLIKIKPRFCANEKKTGSDYGQKFIENVLDCWDIRHVVMLNFQFDVSKIV